MKIMKRILSVVMSLTLALSPAVGTAAAEKGQPGKTVATTVRAALDSGFDQWAGEQGSGYSGRWGEQPDPVEKGGYQKPVTRSAFAWLLGTALAKDTGVTALDMLDHGELEPASFSDVQNDDPYYGEIALCVSKGVMAGTSKTKFGPDSTITREQAATMLSKAVKALRPKEWKKGTGRLKCVTDAKKISSGAKDAVNGVLEMGIMECVGSGKFAPKNTLTLEQALAAVYRMCQRLDIPLTVAEDTTSWIDKYGIDRYFRISGPSVNLAYACPGGKVKKITIESATLSDLPKGKMLELSPIDWAWPEDVSAKTLANVMGSYDDYTQIKYEREYYHTLTVKLTLTLADGTTKKVTDTICRWNYVLGYA